jgi:hypothetical protein
MDYNTQNLKGTSLSDISPNNYQQQMINNNNNNNNMNRQMSDMNSYNMDETISEKFSNKLYNNENHIKEITKEILNGLTDNNISLHDNDSEMHHKKKPKQKKLLEKFENEMDTKTEQAKNLFGEILKSPKFKDMLIIFVLFFLMSQDMIKDLFAQYFTSINPDETGKVGAKGVIIYGIIFSVLFVLIKNFL